MLNCVDWTRNSCDFTSCCAMSPVNHIIVRVYDWYGLMCNAIKWSKASACRFVKSKNQKELHDIPWRCWNWDSIGTTTNSTDSIDTKGENYDNFDVVVDDDPKCYCFFLCILSKVVVIVRNVVCWSRDTLCVKSMLCTACRVIFTFFL